MENKKTFQDYFFGGIGEVGKAVKKIVIVVVVLLIIALVLAIWIL